MSSTTSVDLPRWQFATTAAFHMTFPALPAGLESGYREFLMRVSENRHTAASAIDNPSTAGKSPMNSEATPMPITGMIRPQ
jgi:hypothetical protein